MARQFGLRWMVTTDHGGPNHSKLNLTKAYAELRQSRELVPEVLQFYGMEMNLPGMDHHTLIIPRADFEASALYDLESRFDANDAWPDDDGRNSEAARVAALTYMQSLPRLPLMFANHPARSATGVGRYGRDEPWEFRQNIDTAPEVYRGLEGGPGHQAGTLARDGSPRLTAAGAPAGARGGYGGPGAQTFGGFDQMTALVGGLWDALLGEGRRFWIVATSDSHVHYTETSRSGSDFWPGQFHKTYVHARADYDDVLAGLREGRSFAVSGDLISALDVAASSSRQSAVTGETLQVEAGSPVKISISFRDPEAKNHRGDSPRVARVDLIAGEVRGPAPDRNADRNDTTTVVARFLPASWKARGDVYTIETTLPAVSRSMYVRVRGTSSLDEEPPMDPIGENPWSDLWFYSNPVFISVRSTPTGLR